MIRIPAIPGLDPTAINAPQVDARAAAAPARALGAVAQGIADVAAPFQQLGERIQGFENARLESETRQQWTQGYADLKLELAKDPDPTRHQQRVAEFLQAQKGTLDTPDMAPSVRDRLTLQFDDFAGRATMDTARGAAELAARRGTLALQTEIEEAERIGNPAQFERAIDTGLATGILLPEQAEKMRGDFAHGQRIRELETQAIETPDLFLEEQGPRPHDIDAVAWENLKGTARRQLAIQTSTISGEIQDGIAAGSITRPEQIDELAPDLRPAAREELKADLARRADASFKAVRASPGYQASTVAKVEELLDSYTIDTDGYDTAYVQMDSLVRSLPEGSATRAELTRRIKDSREGQGRRLEDSNDLVLTEFGALREAGIYGTFTTEIETRPFLDAGFLTDGKKLRTLGLSEAQTKAITGAKTNTARLAEFRRLWYQREEADKALTQTQVYRIAEAIAGRQDKIVTTDLAAKERARRAYGMDKIRLNDWLKVNPKATYEQKRAKMIELARASSGASGGFIDSIINTPPPMDGINIDGTLLPPPPDN